MATVGSSTTPQWDSRNNGFIPPSQLNRLRQTSPLAREFGSSDRPLSMATNSPPPQASSTLRPPVPTSSNHARSSSFFAFLKSNDNAPSTMPSRTAEPGLQRQITTDDHGRVYMSGPLVRRVERLPDGNHHLKDEGWREVWAQLGGTTLSIWDMKDIEEASKEGKEVPPIYINVTDAFTQVLGAVTIPASGTTPAQRYNNVVTLNTAGSNLILFSCPNAASLISWATALRLAAWEKARLEEIYTAHLIRITLNDGRNAPSTLVRGRREGWVRIRIAGQTDWKHLFMTIVAGPSQETPGGSTRPGSPPEPQQHRRRISSLFGRDNSSSQSQSSPTGPLVSFYLSAKPKDRKKPFLTLRDVTQAFAVYPERPELINKSTLMKIEGTLGDEEVGGARRKREGWILVMPELEAGVPQANETIRWLTAFHDTFSLYGRPRAYSWDPRDQSSMMYGYPVGPARDLLFLERESAEPLDPREYRTSAAASSQSATSKSPSSNLSTITSLPSTEGPGRGAPQDGSPSLPQIPFLNIGSPGPEAATRRALTPIVEGSFSERDPSRPLVSGVTIPGPVVVSSTTNDVSGPLANDEQRQEPEVPSSAPISPPSAYTPTEGASAPVSPPYEISEESFRRASMAKPSWANGVSLTDDGPSERPSVDNNRTNDVDRVSSSTSVRSLHSPAVSPPSLSPTNSSNPPASVSPVQAPPRTPSPKFSILTSPHSMVDTPSRPNQSFAELGAELSPQSPMTPGLQVTPLEPSKLSQDSIQTSTDSSPDGVHGIYDEAGALYYIQQLEPGSLDLDADPQAMPEGDDEDLNWRREAPHPSQIIQPTVDPLRPKSTSPHPPPSPGRSILSIDTSHRKPPSQPLPRTPTLDYSPDRRPAGARAAPVSNRQDSVTSSSQLSRNFSMPTGGITQQASISQSEDLGEDALAALTFVERHEDEAPAPRPTHSVPLAIASPPSRIPQETPSIIEPDMPQTPESENAAAYKSSFAPSKNAMQRKARSEAQQAAHEAATHRPGHGMGKTRNKAKAVGAWGDSSEEEEEEEEDEEDEDVDSDGEPVAPRDDRSVSNSNYATSSNQRSRFSSPRGPSPLASGGDPPPAQPPSQARPPRNLPPVPIPRAQRIHDGDAAGPRHLEPFEGGRRSYYEDGVSHGGAAPQGPIPTHAPAPIAPRHMWSQVLDPGHAPGAVPENNARETFIQLESPAQTMTKAFTPHGLLSAGLQDKEDRSAKRQEELARETGASLINVPSKPPPPQTGLLGAITAHERDRKREGGVGAALTEREREKRMAEERQRKLDDLQRQQLEQMQQGGSLYGQQLSGYNPMMNPMMIPMMNPFMGYPGMMPGFGNPQHMFAAQQAAQAYQHAMLSLSQAGSQIGGEGGTLAPLNPMMTGGMGPTTPSPLTPMMTGAGMGMGFDPRFSMMGMPMMNPMVMGMGMGNPSMMGAPMGMGMPMSPGPGFDPRMSQFDSGLQVPGSNYGLSGRPASNLGRDGSPAPSEGNRRSGSASPRPLQ
ncbi:hypothetical protein BC827DRAFT_1212394 [Russula dissimulans]|nr:hypothetical protein BC827DRAFT_1212394 [Russula dissimulans]